MGYMDLLGHYFKELDSDENGFVDAIEWLHYLKTKSANSHRDKASRKLRSLSIQHSEILQI
jgi:hypothetical protein